MIEYDDIKGPEITPRWFWNLLTLDLRASFHDYTRACGDVLCDVCQKKLYDHPTYSTGLTLDCNGNLLHL